MSLRYILAVICILAFAGSARADDVPTSQEITIKLPVQSWNVVLQALGELPMKTAYPLMQAIQEQAKTQVTASEKPKK